MHEKKHIGLTLTETAVRALYRDSEGNIRVESASIPSGVIEHGNIIDIRAYASLITQILRPLQEDEEMHITATLCISHTKVFTECIPITSQTRNTNTEQYVIDTALKAIPYTLDELIIHTKIVPVGAMRFGVCTAIPAATMQQYVQACDLAHVTVTHMTSHMYAIAAVLSPSSYTKGTQLVIHVDKHTVHAALYTAPHVPLMSTTFRHKQDTDVAKEDKHPINYLVTEAASRSSPIMETHVYVEQSVSPSPYILEHIPKATRTHVVHEYRGTTVFNTSNERDLILQYLLTTLETDTDVYPNLLLTDRVTISHRYESYIHSFITWLANTLHSLPFNTNYESHIRDLYALRVIAQNQRLLFSVLFCIAALACLVWIISNYT